MKKLGLFFALVFSLLLYSEISAQNVSPQFSELKGMEDAQGNTHLLYRIHSYQHGPNYESGTNNIYPRFVIKEKFLMTANRKEIS